MMENLASQSIDCMTKSVDMAFANYPPGSSGHRRTRWTGPGDQLRGGKRVNRLQEDNVSLNWERVAKRNWEQ